MNCKNLIAIAALLALSTLLSNSLVAGTYYNLPSSKSRENILIKPPAKSPPSNEGTSPNYNGPGVSIPEYCAKGYTKGISFPGSPDYCGSTYPGSYTCNPTEAVQNPCPSGTENFHKIAPNYFCGGSSSPFNFPGCLSGYSIKEGNDHSQELNDDAPSWSYYVICSANLPCGNSGYSVVANLGGTHYCCGP
jgi:hypothetical protein